MTTRTAAVAVLACGAFALVQFRPVRDVDMFWQAATGDLILDTGRLVTADPFTSTHQGDPNPPVYWLSQVFYAGFLRVGTWGQLHTLDAALFAFALWLAGRAAGPGGHPAPAAAAFAVGLLVALPHHGLRPQTFGLLGFAAAVWLDHSRLGLVPRSAAALAVVAVWQNLHPSAAAGFGYLCVRPAADVVRWFRGAGPVPRAGLAAAGAAAVGLFLTPLWAEVFRLAAANAAVSRRVGVEEWAPRWDPAAWPASRAAWVGIVLAAGLLARVGRRARLEDVGVFLLLTAGSLLVFRTSLFWAVAMMPVLARWLADAVPGWSADGGRVPRAAGWAAVLLAVALAVAVPALVGPPVFDPTIPLAGVQQVRDRHVSGVVYNYREWGGPLIREAYPDVRVTIDGRLYLYPDAEWDEYVAAAAGDVPVEVLEAKYHPAAFFLRPSYHAGLVRRLETSGRWKNVYEDETSVLFVPTTAGEP